MVVAVSGRGKAAVTSAVLALVEAVVAVLRRLSEMSSSMTALSGCSEEPAGWMELGDRWR